MLTRIYNYPGSGTNECFFGHLQKQAAEFEQSNCSSMQTEGVVNKKFNNPQTLLLVVNSNSDDVFSRKSQHNFLIIVVAIVTIILLSVTIVTSLAIFCSLKHRCNRRRRRSRVLRASSWKCSLLDIGNARCGALCFHD